MTRAFQLVEVVRSNRADPNADDAVTAPLLYVEVASSHGHDRSGTVITKTRIERYTFGTALGMRLFSRSANAGHDSARLSKICFLHRLEETATSGHKHSRAGGRKYAHDANGQHTCLRFLQFRSILSKIGLSPEIVYWPWQVGLAREPVCFEDNAREPITHL